VSRVRDPLLIDEGEKRIPDEWRQNYLKRSIEELPADVTKAFDRVWQVEREKDKLRADMQEKLRRAKRQIWVMGLIISPIAGELVKRLLHWIFG
jgi:5-methylthioribose kinase